MSVEELEKCAGQALALNRESADLKQLDAALQKRGLAIRSESNGIDSARAKINVRDAKAVAAFNSRLSRNSNAVASYRREIDARNAASGNFRLHQTAFNVQCTGRPYNLDDLAKVPEPARSAMSANSTKTFVPLVDTMSVQSGGSDGGSSIASKDQSSTAAKTELDALQKAADGGDPQAQFKLGQRYLFGKGAPRDPAQALVYLVKAADQGQATAAFDASVLLERGTDVPADPERAMFYLRKAADAGHHGAEQNLALWYETKSRDRDKDQQAFTWMTKAANAGKPEPQLLLAEYYRDGTGTRRNLAEAVTWLTKAANQGYRPAQFELGEALRDGKGVARAPGEALKWFLLAAGMTKVDASAGCTRLIMESSVTRQRAREAVKALQSDLSPAESDRAEAEANTWVAAFKAKPVEGC